MTVSIDPSPEAQKTAEYLISVFQEAADDDVVRAAELASMYVEGLKHSSNIIIRETAQILESYATKPKYLN